MKVKLYMGLSVNGMVAKASGVSDWSSREHIQGFIAACQKSKAVIMGKTIYEQLAPHYLPLKEEGTTVVLTHETPAAPANPTVTFTHQRPEDIVSSLSEKGYQEVVLIGGAKTASEFMHAGLIDEIYFDVEPVLFGNGLPVFDDVAFEHKLALVTAKKLNENTLQLHYQVRK